MQALEASHQSPTDSTKINILQSGSLTSEVPINVLPSIPSDHAADQLLERAYSYTQARYCIVDWVKVRGWHQQRENICYSSEKDDPELQTGWIVPFHWCRRGSRL